MKFKHELCVCPTKLKKILFTVGAAANIDHNPLATTVKQHSFHETAISLTQFPTANNPGIDRERFSICQEFIKKRTVETLPPEYMEIPPSALITSQPTIPSVEGPLKAEATVSFSSVEIEKDWFKSVELLQGKNKLEIKDIISWAAFRVSTQPPLCRSMSITALLPLFTEPTHSTAIDTRCNESCPKGNQSC